MSRTAALSRYLATLDSPPVDDTFNPASLSAAPSEVSASTSGDHDPTSGFEVNFGTSDLFSGHKVVAMPSLGGGSGREFASSKDIGERRRSRSAGRATPHSRDIVQDVYDRMGVSRDDLRGDSDRFNERYRAAAALSATALQQQEHQRGRSIDTSTEGQRRARSLSRGRTVSGRWPPSRSQSQAESGTGDQDAENIAPASSGPTSKGRQASTSTNQQTAPKHTDEVPSSNKINRSSSFPADSIPAWKKSVTPKTATSKNGTPKDNLPDKKTQLVVNTEDSEEGPSPDTSKTPSVRERVKSLSGGKSNRNFPRRKYPVQYNRDHPPPIDIYSDARKQQEEGHDMAAPEPSTVPPSPAAAAAADAAAELVRKQDRNNTTPARSPAAGNHINKKVDHFLATHNKPPTEIAAADESGGVADFNSVALSSVSADDLQDRSPTKPNVLGRWGSNKVVAKPSKSITSAQSISPEQIERLVDERVQFKIAEIERRVEAQLTKLEQRMEERMKERMDMLESKMDKITSLLTILATNNKEI